VTASAGIPTGPGVPAWDPPVTVDELLDGLQLACLIAGPAYDILADGVADDFDAMQAFLDAEGASTRVFGEGVYRYTGQLVIPSGRHVVLAKGAVFKPEFEGHSIIGDSPTPRTPTTTYALTVAATVGAFTVTSPTGAAVLTAGQRVTLRDPSYTLGGENVRRETNIVKSVNTGSGVITLERPIGHAYTTSAWIAPITTAHDVTISGRGEFDMSGVTGGIAADCDAVYFDWPENVVVAGITGYNHPDKIVDFHGGIDSRIEDCNAYAPARDGAGEGYNMRVHYSRNCEIIGGWSRNVRHHADISGGQSCHIRGGHSSGRTTTNQCGAFLHGLESRWCTITGFKGDNIEVGAGAGNGSFGADYDFAIDADSVGCDYGWFISTGCTNGKVRGRADNSVIRGLAVDNSTVDIDVYVDGIQTNPSNYGAVNISGTANVTGRCVIRNALYRSLQSTSSGEVDLDVDIDHPSTATSIPVVSSTMTGTTRFAIGGRVKANNAALAAVAATGGAGTFVYRDGIQILGTYSTRSSIAAGTTILGTPRRVLWGTAAPASGTHEAGDINWRSNPAAGGPPGDVCVTGGTPGTWKAMANLAA
jgi:hypothetical protein